MNTKNHPKGSPTCNRPPQKHSPLALSPSPSTITPHQSPSSATTTTTNVANCSSDGTQAIRDNVVERNTRSSNKNKMILNKSIVYTCSGGMAGLISKTVLAPLERIRILNQSGNSIGFIDTAKQVWMREGIKGYWKGNLTNVYRAVIDKAIIFSSNDMYKQYFVTKLQQESDAAFTGERESGKNNSKNYIGFISGACAGTTAMLVSYPLDLARTRQGGQLGLTSRYKSLSKTLLLTVTEEGPRALYRGCGISLAAVIPYEGIKFGCYDLFMKYFPAEEQKQQDVRQENTAKSNTNYLKSRWVESSKKIVCGSMAGLVAVLITYPNDTIRRRMQLQGMDLQPRLYRHALHCYGEVIQGEGVVALYRGLSATLIRTIPNTAIQFTIYETLKYEYEKSLEN